MAEPTGVAVLASGMLVVSDCTAQKLFQIDPATGAVVAATGSGATAGERLAEFDRPYDVIAVPAVHTATVRVEAYDPDWTRRFGCIQQRALAALQGITTRIEHVGSTSVPGLAAKPTIDVDVIIADESLLPAAVAALLPLGYAHKGEQGIAGRHAFRYSGPTDGGGKRNFYVCIDGADALKNHLVLRDYLRGHPEAAVEYSSLKVHLAERFPRDIDAYVDGKTGLILRLLAAAGFGDGLDAIEQANRLQEEEGGEADGATCTEEVVGDDTLAAAPPPRPQPRKPEERLIVTDRNHHRLVEVAMSTHMDEHCELTAVATVGAEGASLGEFRGPRSVALLLSSPSPSQQGVTVSGQETDDPEASASSTAHGTEDARGGASSAVLAVVENENNRIQLLRWDRYVGSNNPSQIE